MGRGPSHGASRVRGSVALTTRGHSRQFSGFDHSTIEPPKPREKLSNAADEIRRRVEERLVIRPEEANDRAGRQHLVDIGDRRFGKRRDGE